MASTIKIKNSSTASAVPTSSDLVQGELAVNVTDKRIFTENASGTVVELGTNPSIVTLPDGSASAPTLTNDGDTNTGIFFPAADTVAITTGGTERARVDSSGNLGLGVTPSAWRNTYNAFQIGIGGALFGRTATQDQVNVSANYYVNTSNADTYIGTGYATLYKQNTGQHQWYNAASGTAGNAISFTQAMTLDASGYLLVGATSSSGAGTARFQVGDTNSASQLLAKSNTAHASIYASSGADTYFSWNSSGFLAFGQGPTNGSTFTERARIDSSGNLLVGTTNSYARVVVRGTTTGFGSGVQWMRSDADRRWEFIVGGDDKFYLGYAAATTPSAVGNFATNGTYTATSDIRRKKDIDYDFDGLALVNALKPAMGRMLDDDASHPLRPFLIAQDTQPVLPSLVSSLEPDQSVENPILGVDYASMVPVLLKAIQEQQSIITQLQADVAALKAA